MSCDVICGEHAWGLESGRRGELEQSRAVWVTQPRRTWSERRAPIRGPDANAHPRLSGRGEARSSRVGLLQQPQGPACEPALESGTPGPARGRANAEDTRKSSLTVHLVHLLPCVRVSPRDLTAVPLASGTR